MSMKLSPESSLLNGVVSWSVEPDYRVREPRWQIYRIKMQFNSDSGRALELHFDCKTLEKANDLIKILRENNVKWSALFKSHTLLPLKNTIRLHFNSGYVGTILRENYACDVLGMGEVFKMFAQGTGFQSDDFAIDNVNGDTNAVDLVFRSDIPEEARIRKMESTILKVKGTFTNNSG